MSRPPLGPRPSRPRPTWASVVASVAFAAAIPLSLWAAHRPLAGVAVLVAAVASLSALRWMLRLRRCLDECGRAILNPGGRVEVRVGRPNCDPQYSRFRPVPSVVRSRDQFRSAALGERWSACR